MKNNKTCVAYCRVSTTKQAEEGTSLAQQEERIRAYCQNNNIDILRLFIADESGKDITGREVFKECLEYCEKNKSEIDFFITLNTSRASRNLNDFLGFLDKLSEQNITYKPLEDPEVTANNPESRFVASILGAKNQYEREDIVRKTSRGMAYRMKEQGFWCCGLAPLGFKKDDSKHYKGARPVVPDPASYELVKDAFRLFLYANYTQSEIISIVSDMGLRTASGKRLSSQTFSNMLRNPFYAGYIDIKTQKAKYASFDIVTEGEWHKYRVISLRERELILKKLESQSGKKKRKSQERMKIVHPFLLNKCLKCAGCGRLMTIDAAKSRAYYYYRCQRCKVARRCEQLDAEYIQALRGLCFKEEVRASLLGKLEDSFNRKSRNKVETAKRLATQKVALRRKLSRVKEGFLEGLYTSQEANDASKALALEIERIEGNLSSPDCVDRQFESLYSKVEGNLLNFCDFIQSFNPEIRPKLNQILYPEGVQYFGGNLYLGDQIYKFCEKAE